MLTTTKMNTKQETTNTKKETEAYYMSECGKVYILKWEKGYSVHTFAVEMAEKLLLEFQEAAAGCPGEEWEVDVECDVGSSKNFEDIDEEYIAECMTDRVIPRLQQIVGGVITYKLHRMEEGKFRMAIVVDRTYTFEDLCAEEGDLYGLFC